MSNSDSENGIYDVIILGAGSSGLSTAHQILSDKPGTSLLILEARSRCGGRIHTHDLDSNAGQASSANNIDLGASFVHGIIGNPLTELSKKVPFSLHLPPEDASPQIYTSSGDLLPSQQAERLSYLSHSITFERLHSQSQASDSVSPNTSVYSVLKDTKAGEGAWKGVEEKERETLLEISQQWSGWTGASLDEVSFKYWGFEQEFPGEDAIVKEGYGTLIDYYRKEIERLGGEIKLETIVDEVVKNEDDDLISVNQKWKSKFVVCSLPLGVLKHSSSMFKPSLPPRRLSSLKRLGMGLLNKLVLQYSSHWWSTSDRTEGWVMVLPSPKWSSLIASQRSYSSFPISRETSLEFLENCPLLLQDYHQITKQNVLVAFFGPPLAEILESLTEEESSKIIHKRLMSTVATQSKEKNSIEKPCKVITTRWNSDPFSRGSYSYLPCSSEGDDGDGATPLDMMECSHPLWNGKLGWVGEHTDPDCYASVHGALLSGQREGKRVAALLNAQKP